ncbi:MAG: radical SAM protein [Pseudomonadota bacterium]
MNKNHYLKIPYSPYTDTLGKNLSYIKEYSKQLFPNKKLNIAIYGMGPNGIYLSDTLSGFNFIKSTLCVDRRVSITTKGKASIKPEELITQNNIDLLIVTTAPQHYKAIENSVCKHLKNIHVLYIFKHFVGQTYHTNSDTTFSPITAIKSAINSRKYFSANLLIRSNLHIQPYNHRLLMLKDHIAKLVNEKDLENDELIGNVNCPYNIIIQIIDNCNLKCYMCFRQNGTYSPPPFFKKPMSRVIFQQILKDVDFNNVASVCLGGSGEVFMHPDILYFMDYILERGSRVQFITNGSLLNSTLSEELAKRSGYDLQLSLDAFSKKTYDSIRVGAVFDDVIKKFTYFVNCLSKSKTDVNLSITSVLMRRAIEEFPMIIRFAAELGIPVVTGNNIVMTGHAAKDPEESLIFHPLLFNRVRSESLELAAKKGVTLNFPEPFPLKKKELKITKIGGEANHWDICHEPWTRLDMRSGSFHFCCGGHPGIPFKSEFMDTPEAKPFSLKNMTGYNSIKELFNCKILRTLRTQLLTNKPPKYCRNCFQQSNNLHNFNFHSAFSQDLLAPDVYQTAKNSFEKKFQGQEYLEIMLR